jgi:hypothetical protein
MEWGPTDRLAGIPLSSPALDRTRFAGSAYNEE